MKFLGILKAFFIKDGRKYQPSFVFANLTFLVELGGAFFLFLQISRGVRFEGLLGKNSFLIAAVVISFFVRVYILHLLLGFVLRILEAIFHVKRPYFVYLSLLLYCFLFLAIKYPQIYDEFSSINRFLMWARFFDKVWLLPITVVAFLLLLNTNFYRFGEKNLRNYFFAGLANIFLLFFFFHFQALQSTIEAPHSSIAIKTDRPHIIILTMDSLRGDVNLAHANQINSSFKSFLKQSISFDRVISALAQTHGALSSLFSAQPPPKNGVRSNLSGTTLDTDKFLHESELEEFKKQGYRIEFLQDTQEYSNFFDGQIISKIDSPRSSIANVFISNFFKNRIIFSLFNNSLGRWILPEINNNSSFSYSYDVGDFTNRVSRKIVELSQSDQPTVLFVHTCAIHWPGVYPYPYYPTDGFPSFTLNPFSYTSRFRGLHQKLNPAQWEVQSEFNRKIYEGGIQMLVQRFLNPIMSQLDATDLMRQAVVVLMSDHGENFWHGGSFPKRRYVEHGGSLIFSADSELANLNISFPGILGAHMHKNVGIIDIFPSIADYLQMPSLSVEGKSFLRQGGGPDDERFYYSETGLWMFSLFSSQFSVTPVQELGPLFRVDSSHQTFYIAPINTPAIVQQKQRALYWKNYRYTLFPTNSGYREFLCDRDRNYLCTENLLNKEPGLTKKFREHMDRYIQMDVDSHMLTIGPCSSLIERKDFPLKDVQRYQWQYYFQANECLNQWHDHSYAMKVFSQLLLSESTTPYLHDKILSVLVKECASEELNKTNTQATVRKVLLDNLWAGHFNNKHFRFVDSLNVCFSKLGLNSENSDVSRYVKSLLAGNIKKHQLKYQESLEESDLIDDANEAEDLSQVSIRNLFHTFLESQGLQHENLRQQVLNHPDFSEIRDTYQMTEVLEKEKDPAKIDSQLKALFKNQESYDLTDDRSPYLTVIWRLRYRQSPDQAMIYAIHQMISENLPLGYFNLLLYDIDSITRRSSVDISVSKLRRQFATLNGDNRAYNIKNLEVGLSIIKLENYFCSSQQTKLNCADLRHLKHLNSSALAWEKFLRKPIPNRDLSQFLKAHLD